MNPQCIEQNPVVPSEFLITRVCTLLVNVFFRYTPTTAHLYECVMTELRIKEYSAFMKDLFVSLTMTNIHPFDVCSIETDLFLFTSQFAILASEMFKDSKDIAKKVLANILTSMHRANHSLCYQSRY